MSIYVPGTGNMNARLMIVGDYPGASEVAHTPPMPFVGVEGEEIRSLLHECGYDWSELYVTNVYKYRPPIPYKRGIKYETWPRWDQCYAQLWQEIETIMPNVILTFGALSFEILTSKTKLMDYRGSILRSSRQINNRFFKVVPTIHPINYLKPKGEGGVKFQARAYVISDIEKAIEESRSEEFNLPSRKLKIIQDSAELDNFFTAYSSKKECAVDIETSKSCLPVCVSFAFSPHYAVSVPLSHLVSRAQERERARLWRLVAEFFRRKDLRIVGQNFKFDHAKLNAVGLTIPHEAIYADTQLLHHTLYPEYPKNLGFICSVHTKEPYYKDEGKGFDPKKEKPDRLLEYNAKDSAVEIEVFFTLLAQMHEIDAEEGTQLTDFFFNYVMKLHRFYMDMEEEGIAVDDRKRADQYIKYSLKLYDLSQECLKRFGYIPNPNANNKGGQVWQFIYEVLGLPQRDSVDDETLSALFGNHCKKPEQKFGVDYILDARKIRKHLSTTIAAEPDFDGRMRTNYSICGTETGRSATGVLKQPLRRDQCGMSFHAIPHHGEYGDCQEYLVADPGYIFGITDLSQAEARVVANLARDYELLASFDVEDVHWKTAGLALEFDHLRIKCPAKDDPRRFLGKMCRHGGNYGMRKRAFAEHVNQNIKRFAIPIDMISEYKGGLMLDRFHKGSPRIRGVFHREIVETLERDPKKRLITPHGRRRQFFDRWGEELWKEAYAFIPQATVIDALRLAALRIKQRCPTIRFFMEHHDALKWQSRREEFVEHAEIVKEELNKPIDFSLCSLPREPLIIPADVEYGRNLAGFSQSNPLGMRKFKGKIEV